MSLSVNSIFTVSAKLTLNVVMVQMSLIKMANRGNGGKLC